MVIRWENRSKLKITQQSDAWPRDQLGHQLCGGSGQVEAEKVWRVEENAWSWCWGGLPWWRRAWGGWRHGELLGLSQIPG